MRARRGRRGLAIAAGVATLLGRPRGGLAAPFAYVTSINADTVSVIDVATAMITATLPTGTSPRGSKPGFPAVNRAATRVYVPNLYTPVDLFATPANTLVATVPVSDEIHEVTLSIATPSPARSRSKGLAKPSPWPLRATACTWGWWIIST